MSTSGPKPFLHVTLTREQVQEAVVEYLKNRHGLEGLHVTFEIEKTGFWTKEVYTFFKGVSVRCTAPRVPEPTAAKTEVSDV